MNPRTKRILIAAGLAVAVGLIWLLFPRTLDQAMGGDFDRTEVLSVQALLMSRGESKEVTIDPKDPACQELLTLLDSRRYVRTPPRQWQEITLAYHVILAFGTEGADHCMDFTGDDGMRFYGSHVRDRWFRTPGGEAFQQEILDLLLAQPHTVE